MSFSFGNKLKISIFGQSHSPMMGVSIDGLPAGEEISVDEINAFMARRAPGKSKLSTARKESDIPQIISGLAGGRTCGAPLAAVIANSDARSSDYDELKNVPRPSHADYAAFVKYGGHNDISGGGQFSGRLTAPLCFAGAVALQLLNRRGVAIGAHILSVGAERDEPPENISRELLASLPSKALAVFDDSAGARMSDVIEEARMSADSVGGCVECFALGVEAGIGEPMFDGIENRISAAVFAIPAVKGIEFGDGFGFAEMRGSQANDAYAIRGGRVTLKTNHCGGIIGGITSGAPIVFRTAFKPTPSIGMEQDSVDLRTMSEVKLTVKGRHDPCIVPRAVPCVEAAAAVALLDLML